jgi:Ca2+-binding RTX toxin-like protein
MGDDILIGNAGRDYFMFRSVEDSGLSTPDSDIVMHFSHSQRDRLYISLIDADEGRAGNQAFDFIGREAFSEAGQVRYSYAHGDTYVWLNTDADRSAESMFRIDGQKTLVASDFVL